MDGVKKSGISINDGPTVSRHSGAELAVLTDLLEERYADYAEAGRSSRTTCSGRMESGCRAGAWHTISSDGHACSGHYGVGTGPPTTGGARALVGVNKIAASAQIRRLRGSAERDGSVEAYGGRPTRALCAAASSKGCARSPRKGLLHATGFTGTQDIGIGRSDWTIWCSSMIRRWTTWPQQAMLHH